jgi:uncharacterized membrane protein HdeD (DUF308 family)
VRGRDAALVVAFWGLLNLALATLMFAFTTDLMSHVVYWLAVAFVFAAAVPAWFAHDPPRRRLPEASAAILAIAIGLTFLALGAALGIWAVFMGAAGVALGLVLLALERWMT